jgi:hypothetical protein
MKVIKNFKCCHLGGGINFEAATFESQPKAAENFSTGWEILRANRLFYSKR